MNTLNSQQKAFLRRVLQDADIREVLTAAFQTECQVWEKRALAHLAKNETDNACYSAAHADAWRSAMVRLESMSEEE